jgi:predicted transcriptional regulator of viral defense system
MGGFTVFSLGDIRQADPLFHRRRLNEWQDKGYLKKIIKGYYIFDDFPIDERVLFEIANRIYSPSYVSFEMALAYYGMIPESIYGVTSASTRKTMHFKTALGEFSYRTITPKLYFGFDYLPVSEKFFKIASPEKALLDYMYLHDELNNVDDFAQMRLNREVYIKKVDCKKLASYAAVYGQKSFNRRLKVFLEYIAYA